MEEIIETDVLVIGAGIAGCRAAIEARDLNAKVVIVTKGIFGKDCAATWMACLGYQCWGIHPNDTLDAHVYDTLRYGWFLNNQENAYAFLAQIPNTIRDLLGWGLRFKMVGSQLLTMRQQGCSIQEGRSVTPIRGEIGRNLASTLPILVKAKKINIVEDTFITDLLTKKGAVVGALGINIRTGEFRIFVSKSTILATGGYEGLYRNVTSSPQLTGDGQAMAIRAGADMVDFEFNQLIPTAVWPPTLAGERLPYSLLSSWEARLYNNEAERFMAKWDHWSMERATRAMISRAILHEIEAGRGSSHGGVYCSVSHLSEITFRQKIKDDRVRIFSRAKKSGVDLHRDYVETACSVHYCQGGCNVNTKCETDLVGLYAIGEVASGSKDGADRMESNSLPYSMAMGILGGREAAARSKTAPTPELDYSQLHKFERRAHASLEREGGLSVFEAKFELQGLATRGTAGLRTETILKNFLEKIDRFKKDLVPKLCTFNKSRTFNFEWIDILQFENLLLIAECVASNALMREESRGSHDRIDFPELRSDWFKNIHLKKMNDELKLRTSDVDFVYWTPEEGSLGEPWKKGIQVREYKGWRAKPLCRI